MTEVHYWDTGLDYDMREEARSCAEMHNDTELYVDEERNRPDEDEEDESDAALTDWSTY